VLNVVAQFRGSGGNPLWPLSRGVLVTPPAPRSPIVDIVRCPIPWVSHLRHRSVRVILLAVHQCWIEHGSIVSLVLLLDGVLLHDALVDGHVGVPGRSGGWRNTANLGHLLGGVVVACWEGEMRCRWWSGGNCAVFTGL